MMVKSIAALLLVAIAATAVYADEMTCDLPEITIPTEWVSMKPLCVNAVRDQIQKEIDASYTYLAMGAHFSRDTVNRPGFAEHFFKAAKEEREHGHKLIEYLSMRGDLTKSVTGLIKTPNVKKTSWASGEEALNDALLLETSVTESIRSLIKTCERNHNDYHLVDYLTGVYLEEQLTGQRELAGKLSTLKKMMNAHGPLAEFLFDKNM